MTSISKLDILISDINHQEILIAFADQQGLNGIEQTESGLIIHSDDHTSIRQYIATILDLPFLDKDQVMMSFIPSQNWNSIWESSFQAIRVNTFCGIRASFHDQLSDVEHEIIINPELAFGTGHHETTYLMIEQMRELDFENKRVLDYGCGTAILSILAEQLGAQEIDAIDIEEQAISCANDCIGLNNCQHIKLTAGSLEQVHGIYDIILANINRNVLLTSAQHLLELLGSDGVLLLSGILIEDADRVIYQYSNLGWMLLGLNQKGEWCSMQLTQKPSHDEMI